MILKKPYAFFIKYFRVINLIMAVLMALLIYQTLKVGKFLNLYISDYLTATNNFVLSNYINIYTFLLIILIIIFTIVVTSVMFIKNKPKKLYLFNLIVYVALFVLYIVDYNIMSAINDRILDIRISKAIRDVTYIGLGVQVVSFIITLVRTTGFDIKSFDFKKDLQELEIDIKDNEEFEVAVDIDRNSIHRDFRNGIRNFRYFYTENKYLIIISFILLAVLAIFFVIMHRVIYIASYNENETFSASSLSFNVRNSYVTNANSSGKVISDNTLVIVKLDVHKFSEAKATLNTGLITLTIGDKSFGETTKYNGYLSDMGTPYVDEELSLEFESYLLVYEVPNYLANKKMALKINDNVSYIRGEIGAKNIYVTLKPINLLDVTSVEEAKLGSDLSFSGSILGESTFVINKFELANRFKLEYNFCFKKDNCVTSYEYMVPTATGNYFKTLLKIDGKFKGDESVNDNINNMFDFLNEFGYIHYKVDGEWDSHKIDSQKIKPIASKPDNSIYVEVNRKILDADSIYLEFKVRNYSYKYVLK